MAAPAVEELKTILEKTFPELLTKTFWDASWDNGKDKDGKSRPKGKMAPRLQAAGKGVKSDDPHLNGLAIDIFLFKNNPSEWMLAQDLVNVFLTNKAIMGWSAVIYDSQITDDFGGPKSYTKDKHETHIHIEWPRSRGTASTGFSSKIQDHLDAVALSWHSSE